LKAVLKISDVKEGANISSDGGFIITPPGDDWSAVVLDIKTCNNVHLSGFHIIIVNSKFKYKMIQKILGTIGWKELIFG
jgi:hypothetical protein